jgi:hypothetical protein
MLRRGASSDSGSCSGTAGQSGGCTTEREYLVPKWYVFTGAPGSGKTALLGALRQRGHVVVDEAATEVIARLHS